MNNTVIVTKEDARRLAGMAHRLRSSGRSRMDHVAELEQRLEQAHLVEPTAVPADVVTLNSRVRLRNVDTRRRLEVALADPVNIPLFSDYLSVAGPAGMALLGRRVGEVVTWALGTKHRAYRIERVLYQPEAAGDFHL